MWSKRSRCRLPLLLTFFQQSPSVLRTLLPSPMRCMVRELEQSLLILLLDPLLDRALDIQSECLLPVGLALL